MRYRLLALLCALVVLFVASLESASAAASFKVGCTYVRTLPDDPIVYPGLPGASHSHDFFGNTTTNASSTRASMAAGSTTCNNSGDLAGYWLPSLYLGGSRVAPTRVSVYYYRRVSGTLLAFPAGFEMIAGDRNATAPQSTKVVYYGCGTSSGLSKVTYLPDCSGTGGFLQIHVIFPDCWDGTFTGGNDSAHVAYHLSTGTCPAGFPKAFPQLVVAEAFKTIVDSRNASLASGSYVTEHADYWSIWKPGVLEGLVASL